MATNFNAGARDPLLVVIVGPTASGKTALSLALAEQLNGEIISCDSVAVYRGMDIGSAKPTPAEQARVPHHLIDVTTPATDYTAGDYGRAARAAARDIAARGKTPIVVGGTGLYLRALLDGFTPVPTRFEALRDRLRAFATRRGNLALHRVLRRADPAAADRIHVNDTPKVIRAIEVSVLAGRPMSDAWKQAPPEPLMGFHVVQFGLNPPREELYERINARCAAMFAQGLVHETSTLTEQYGPDRPAFRALGYAQAATLLDPQETIAAADDMLHRNVGMARETLADFGARSPRKIPKVTDADALAATQQGHRRYAKRQLTWFRRDPRIHWLPMFGDDALPELLKALET